MKTTKTPVEEERATFFTCLYISYCRIRGRVLSGVCVFRLQVFGMGFVPCRVVKFANQN